MTDSRATSKLTRVVVSICFILGAILLYLAALQVLAAFTPAVPILGFLGSVLLPKAAPRFVLFGLVALAVSVFRWKSTRSRAALIAIGVAVFTAIGSATVLGLMIHAANKNGVSIDLAQTFGNTSVMTDSSHQEVADYSSFEGKPLQLAIYKPGSTPPEGGFPILLYVHGGGWVAGTKDDRVRDMHWFADHGWIVFAISYGLTTEQRPMWASITPQVGCSMVWLASHAASYGGDISRLSLIGESAGGNLVLNSTYMANSGKLMSSCGGTVPKVRAVVAAYPVVSADAEFNHHDLILGGFAHKMAIYYTGGTPQQYPERYAAVRSTTHITPSAPPTLVIEGERDHLVPPSATYDFVDQARAAGIAASLIRVPFGEHSFDLVEGSVGDQIFRKASLQFLNSHVPQVSK